MSFFVYVLIASLLSILRNTSILADKIDNTPTFDFEHISIPQLKNISLRGLSVYSEDLVWLGGEHGTVVTIDHGNITVATVPGAEGLDFRDVQVRSPRDVLLMAAGFPARIYRFLPSLAEYEVVYENNKTGAYLNSMDFWDDEVGVAFGDVLDGRPLILTTRDGGRSWMEADLDGVPVLDNGEIGFAASGTSVVVHPPSVGEEGTAWIGLGGGGEGSMAKVLLTSEYGMSWRIVETTVVADSPSKGIFSMATYSRNGTDIVVAVGGDYKHTEAGGPGMGSISTDGGLTFHNMNQPPRSYRSCVIFSQAGQDGGIIGMATGENGMDYSLDMGHSWNAIESVEKGFHVLGQCKGCKNLWLAGKNGQVSTLQVNL